MTEVFACTGCGQVNEHATRTVEELRASLDAADREIGIKQRQIGALRKQQAGDITKNQHYETAMRVLEHWKRLCAPRTRELNGPRLRACIARLEHGYTEADLMKCVTGYSRYPYVVDGRRSAVGPSDKRFVDAELIFRDAKRVDSGIVMAENDQAEPKTPTSVMASLPWREVQRANYRALKAALDKEFGQGADDGMLAANLLYPCPRCRTEAGGFDPLVATLRLARPGTYTWLARCSKCGCDDEQLIRALKDPVGLAVV